MSMGGIGGVTTLQVVLAEAAALRMPDSTESSGCTSMAAYCSDLITPVPAARWDWEQQAAAASLAGDGRLPARFGGFLDGGWVGGCGAGPGELPYE